MGFFWEELAVERELDLHRSFFPPPIVETEEWAWEMEPVEPKRGTFDRLTSSETTLFELTLLYFSTAQHFHHSRLRSV